MELTAEKTPTRTYSITQHAARDYMQAQKVIDTLKADAKPAEAAKKAATAILAEAFPATNIGDRNVQVITGCWNVPLTFENRVDSSVKWAKVMEGLAPHLTTSQADILARIIEANTGKRNVRKLEV